MRLFHSKAHIIYNFLNHNSPLKVVYIGSKADDSIRISCPIDIKHKLRSIMKKHLFKLGILALWACAYNGFSQCPIPNKDFKKSSDCLYSLTNGAEHVLSEAH